MFTGIIYKYTNELDNNKVYIGQTVNEHKRKIDHKNSKKKDRFHGAIRKYGFDSFKYSVLFKITCKDLQDLSNTLNIKEKIAIKYYNSTDPKFGYNTSAGYDDFSYINHESKSIIQLDMNCNFIKEWDSYLGIVNKYDLDSSSLSKCSKAWDDDGVTNKSCHGYLWIYKDIYYSLVKNNKTLRYINLSESPVVQLTVDNKFIREWSNIKLAATTLNISKSGISKSCLRLRKNIIAGGFKWQYKNDYESGIKPLEKKDITKSIVQLTLDGKFVKRFDKMEDTRSEFGNRVLKENLIIDNKGNRSSFGFMWMLEEDYEKYKNNITPYSRGTKKSFDIVLLSKSMKVIGTWKSMMKAHKDLGINISVIQNCLKTGRPSTKGLIFMRVDDYKELMSNIKSSTINIIRNVTKPLKNYLL